MNPSTSTPKADKRSRLNILLLALILTGLSGCTTVTVYQDPVSRFQTAVNSANDAIRPYLVGVNSLIAEANLYDKVNLNQPWGSEDLKAGIPEEAIQVRLQALATIASYANALGAMANSQDVENLQKAAKTLGDDVNSLHTTVTTFASSPAGKGKGNPVDLSGPISSLVTLFGTPAIEHMETKALEKAILDGDKPISDLIDLLKQDLRALTLVDVTSYDAMQAGMVKLYNDARAKTDPKSLIALIDQFVQANRQIETLRSLQVDSLLSDMKAAHTALVTFAKSGKQSKDLATLASQIDVFTAHVKLFNDALASLQSLQKP